MNKNKIFWGLTIALLLGIFLPTLVQQGMFLDGVTYSTISNNLANGNGSFLEPHYTKTVGPKFNEHPPLVFFIQSLFFRVFGDGFLTEKIYCFFILVLTAIGISKCWSLLNDDKEYAWLPVLLWLTVPLVSWSYKNNILEDTMGVFTIFSVYFILKSLIEKRILYLLLGSSFIIFAFLSKGFTGLFPLAIPAIFALVYKKYKISLSYTIYLVLITASVFAIILLVFPGLKANLSLYFDQQLIPALNNEREVTTNNRFWVLSKLILELSIPILLLIIVSIKQRMSNGKFIAAYKKQSFIFLLIAIAASLPLVVSLKQRAFYLIPSVPFYVLTIGFLVFPFVKNISAKMSTTAVKWINRVSQVAIIVTIILSVFLFGKFSRDEDKITDIQKISEVLPRGTIIGTPIKLSTNWGLVANMGRIGYISLDGDGEHQYYLKEKDILGESTEIGNYEKVNLDLVKYDLMKRIEVIKN